MRTPQEFTGPRPYRFILTSHLSRYLSGVARFNQMLAERLGVECVGPEPGLLPSEGPALVSVKLSDADPDLTASMVRCVEQLGREHVTFDVFFHSFDSLPAELSLLAGCRQVFSGNAEIARDVRRHGYGAERLWCPPLVDPVSVGRRGRLTIFSFGMSHKIQTTYYLQLRSLLDTARMQAQLMISTAFHEKADFGDIDVIERTFRQTFGDDVHLLGFLSDAAINHFLTYCDLFCAFFPSGVRANNTTVVAAMCAGAPVLTNLDEYSPEWMRHGDTVLDLNRLAATDLTADSLRVIAARGKTVAMAVTPWSRLIERLAASAETASGQALPAPADAATRSPAEAGILDPVPVG